MVRVCDVNCLLFVGVKGYSNGNLEQMQTARLSEHEVCFCTVPTGMLEL